MTYKWIGLPRTKLFRHRETFDRILEWWKTSFPFPLMGYKIAYVNAEYFSSDFRRAMNLFHLVSLVSQNSRSLKGSTRKPERSDWPFTAISKTMKKNLFPWFWVNPVLIRYSNIYRVNTSLATGNCQRSQILSYTFIECRYSSKKRCLRILEILTINLSFVLSLFLSFCFSLCFPVSFRFIDKLISRELPRCANQSTKVRKVGDWTVNTGQWNETYEKIKKDKCDVRRRSRERSGRKIKGMEEE